MISLASTTVFALLWSSFATALRLGFMQEFLQFFVRKAMDDFFFFVVEVAEELDVIHQIGRGSFAQFSLCGLVHQVSDLPPQNLDRLREHCRDVVVVFRGGSRRRSSVSGGSGTDTALWRDYDFTHFSFRRLLRERVDVRIQLHSQH